MKPIEWFGSTPFAMICTPESQVEVPIGTTCQWCGESISEFDLGFRAAHLGMTKMEYRSWHRECFLRTMSGPVAHVRRQCSCYGGKVSHDIIGLSRRKEAKLASELWLLDGMELDLRAFSK